jgi:ABC-2 type transport system permease protein
MRSKLNFLIGISLKRKIVTKWFIIANIFLALAIIGISNIDSIIKAFGGDFTKPQEIYVIDNTNIGFELFKKNMGDTSSIIEDQGLSLKYQVTKYDGSVDAAKAEIEKKPTLWIIVFESDASNVLKATVISEGYIDTLDYQILISAINSTKMSVAIEESNIPLEELNKIIGITEIDREYIDLSKKSEDEQMEAIMTTVFPAFILPFFMLTIFLVQMIGAEVNDEKSTRSMEIIISNVSPQTHFFAKVVAGNMFVFIQGGLLLVYGMLGLLLRGITGASGVTDGVGKFIGDTVKNILETGLADKLVYIVPLTILLMILTFLAYSLVAGILASMTTNIEDYQQLQTPIMLVSVVGYYLSMTAGLFEGSVLIRLISYVPFISAILSPSLLVLGYIGIVDVLVSILLMIGTLYLLIKYGIRIYKVGILNYASSDLWKKMLKALKGE